MIDNVLNPANTSGPPPLPSATGSSNPATTTTLTVAATSSKSGWTTGAKAGLGIGIALLLVSFSAGVYFLLRWLRHRPTKSESGSQVKKPGVVWNVGPKWMQRGSKQGGGERGMTPQELEGEGKMADMGIASPGISEASTVTMSERSGYERRIGSWGGELEGSAAKYQVVRGHLEESD
ncbi:hypothetical protein N431DRAFT_434421 [Stipitochalara longipes BDJ]|nr:hypothetical protein N431DRAFT_434421 [Stipitochalara longipes BDJ]